MAGELLSYISQTEIGLLSLCIICGDCALFVETLRCLGSVGLTEHSNRRCCSARSLQSERFNRSHKVCMYFSFPMQTKLVGRKNVKNLFGPLALQFRNRVEMQGVLIGRLCFLFRHKIQYFVTFPVTMQIT